MDVSFEMMSTAEEARYSLEKADLMLNEAIELNGKNKNNEVSEYDDEMHIWIALDYVQKAMDQIEKIITVWTEATKEKRQKGGK